MDLRDTRCTEGKSLTLSGSEGHSVEGKSLTLRDTRWRQSPEGHSVNLRDTR